VVAAQAGLKRWDILLRWSSSTRRWQHPRWRQVLGASDIDVNAIEKVRALWLKALGHSDEEICE
jgi:hypothetical protein